jgi:hypothetical protein
MTKMPGRPLFDQRYWDMATDIREDICRKFMDVLRNIYALGIEPIDCGLRNIMWDPDTKTWLVQLQALFRPYLI